MFKLIIVFVNKIGNCQSCYFCTLYKYKLRLFIMDLTLSIKIITSSYQITIWFFLKKRPNLIGWWG